MSAPDGDKRMQTMRDVIREARRPIGCGNTVTYNRMSNTENPKDDDLTAAPPSDPSQMARNVARFFDECSKVVSAVAEKTNSRGGPYSVSSDISEAAKVFGSVAEQWVNTPSKLVDAQSKLVQGYVEL